MEINTSTALNATFRQVNRDAAEHITARQPIATPKNNGSVRGITVYLMVTNESNEKMQMVSKEDLSLKNAGSRKKRATAKPNKIDPTLTATIAQTFPKPSRMRTAISAGYPGGYCAGCP